MQCGSSAEAGRAFILALATQPAQLGRQSPPPFPAIAIASHARTQTGGGRATGSRAQIASIEKQLARAWQNRTG